MNSKHESFVRASIAVMLVLLTLLTLRQFWPARVAQAKSTPAYSTNVVGPAYDADAKVEATLQDRAKHGWSLVTMSVHLHKYGNGTLAPVYLLVFRK
ncbi:MAG: hypothetical protein ACRD8A_10225 [Candidatus Acidiferrales bacterium]